MTKTKDIDINQIKHLYYHEKKSASQIAEILGCSTQVIYARMKKHGIQRRSYSEAHKLRHTQRDPNMNDPEIVRLYFEEHLTIAKVAKRLDLSYYMVRKRLVDMGYERRKGGRGQDSLTSRASQFTDTDLAEMKRLYCEEGESAPEIAHRYDCTDAAVRKHLRRQGVRIRTVKEAQALRRKREKKQTEVPKERNGSPRTYTPPKRVGKVFDPYPVLSSEQVTPERILQLYNKDDLMITDIAEICSLSPVEVYNILQERRGI